MPLLLRYITNLCKTLDKHDKIPRPQIGIFYRHELAELGTPCGQIEKLIQALALPELKMAYVDADHRADEADRPAVMQAGSYGAFSDKISFTRLDFSERLSDSQKKITLNHADWALANGNHFEAAAQIAVIAPAKPLEKKLHKLNNAQLLLKVVNDPTVPNYLQGRKIPALSFFYDVQSIPDWVGDYLAQRRAPLFGLVLVGGKSKRMGTDKAQVVYHDKPQQLHAANLLAPYCERAFISCRGEQAASLPQDFLSAFRQYSDAAWVTLACDLPLIRSATLEQLINGRRLYKTATAFQNPYDNFPEPLVIIWEPKAYPLPLQLLGLDYQFRDKALINSDIALLQPNFPEQLTNANTPEESIAVFTETS